MARLPYVTDAEADADPANSALVAAIRARRGGAFINLDRQLLHSPPLAEGWNALLGAVRTQLTVDMRLRELAMCVVAVINGADYEFLHHAPLFVQAGGSQAQIDAVRRMETETIDPALFDALGNATIALSRQMTEQVAVDDETFAHLRALLPDRQVVELVGVVATYNMVSRFLVAIGVEPE